LRFFEKKSSSVLLNISDYAKECKNFDNTLKNISTSYDKEIIFGLTIVGAFFINNNKLLIRDDKNNEKKLGAIKEVAKYLNSLEDDKDQNQWEGLLDEKNFIIQKKYYDQTIKKKLSFNFLEEKIIDELGNFCQKLKIFRNACILLNSKSEKLEIRSPFEFLRIIQEEGKKSFSIQRFKGLGEMNPDELWETTLNPKNNTLLKVKYSNNGEANVTKPNEKDHEIFKILMGDDVLPRKEFIMKNAIKVSNLDV